MERKNTEQHQNRAKNDREKKIKNPGKAKKKSKRHIHQQYEEWDDLDRELLQFKQTESLEDYFDD